MIDHDDWVDVLVLDRRWIQRARKDHTCSYCRDTIPTGTSYQRTAALIDGEFRVERIHPSGACMFGYYYVGDESY